MVEIKYLITNGQPTSETIDGLIKRGWNFVCTVPAKLIHPKALDTDKATIFSKYISYEQEENEIQTMS